MTPLDFIPHAQTSPNLHKIILLHTNDLHAELDGMARLAGVIESIQADNPSASVIYVDAGDVEDHRIQLSDFTKGAAMYPILAAMGCAVSTQGDAALLRYGPRMAQVYAQAGGFPLVVANLRDAGGNPLSGLEPRHVLVTNAATIGFIGVTRPLAGYQTYFNYQLPSIRHVVRDLATALWQDGVDMVVLLSHLGLTEDVQLAQQLQDVVQLIIGAHSHDVLTGGQQVGNVMIVQAGARASHLGRVDLVLDADERLVIERVQVIPVALTAPASPKVAETIEQLTQAMEDYLDETLVELDHPLTYTLTEECTIGNLLADAIRYHQNAQIGLCVVGQAVSGGMLAGSLTRRQVWTVCTSSANPGLVNLSGAQLQALVAQGINPILAGDTTLPALQGRARGYMHLSGVVWKDEALWLVGEGEVLTPLNPDTSYQIAATDFELLPQFGYTLAEWRLAPLYDTTSILREVVEDYLIQCPKPLAVTTGRVMRG